MVSLGLSGIVLFSVSVAALAAPDNYQTTFFEGTWKGLSSSDKQVHTTPQVLVCTRAIECNTSIYILYVWFLACFVM